MPLSHATHRNLIVIGCGPHYQKRYHPVLEEQGAIISLVIDLQEKKTVVLDFFKDKKSKPMKTLFFDDSFRNTISVDEIETAVANRIDLSPVDAVILCTEPKVRKSYALWAFKHRFPLFMDKPPCAFLDTRKMDTLLLDYEEIVTSAEKAQVNVVVSCERRAHFGYLWLMDYLRLFTQREQVPVTSIDIHFANGNWVTPIEYVQQEHHPFKYGYGLLLHSGYHYIDLLVSFLSFNDINEVEYSLKLIYTSAEEQLTSIGNDSAQRLSDPHPSLREKYGGLRHSGETDFLLIGQAKKRGQLLSNFSVKLINTSVSKRISSTPSVEAKWRARQEHVIVHIGHLASAHVTCNPLKKFDSQAYPTEDFTILIMHSPLLVHRKPIIQMTREDLFDMAPFIERTASLNQCAREWQLKEFLHGRDGNSSLQSHRNTMHLLNLIYSQIRSERILQNDRSLETCLYTNSSK